MIESISKCSPWWQAGPTQHHEHGNISICEGLSTHPSKSYYDK